MSEMSPEQEYEFYQDPEHLVTAGPGVHRKPVVAFDVDGTLIDEKDKPRWDIIWLLQNLAPYCTVVVWSGRGISYAKQWGRRLFLPGGVVYRDKAGHADICFDDEHVTLGTVNIRVR